MYKFLKFIRDTRNRWARLKHGAVIWYRTKLFELKEGRKPYPEEWIGVTKAKFFESDDGTEIIAFQTIAAFGNFTNDIGWESDVWEENLPFMFGMANWNLGGERYDLSLHKQYSRTTNSRYPIRRGLAYEYIYGNAKSVKRIAFRKDFRELIMGDKYKNDVVDCYVKF